MDIKIFTEMLNDKAFTDYKNSSDRGLFAWLVYFSRRRGKLQFL